MSKVQSNERLAQDFYLMKVEDENAAKMGQFYMLRAWDQYPVLSRPISVFDSDGQSVTFLYKVVGKGTERFAQLKPGDEITLQGPLGNSIPKLDGTIALVGGGVGVAPLYLAAKQLRKLSPGCTIHLYLGYSAQTLLEEAYRQVADRVTINVGGVVIDEVQPQAYDHIFTCGPEVMMRAMYEKCKQAGVGDRLLVSMENRMACGVGACLVCSCKTKDGNRKACKDGPVFSGEAVFGQ